MNAISDLKSTLQTSRVIITPLLDDMKDAPLTYPTPNGGNHPLWVMGHLAYSESSILNHVIAGRDNPLAEWKPLFSGSTTPVDDASKYPAWDEIKQAFDHVHDATLKSLDVLNAEDLEQPSPNCPPGREPILGTVGLSYRFIALHTMMHFGQVADARYALGRKPLIA